MLKIIDNFLDRTTMYRLVLYYLSAILALAFIFSLFHLLPYNPISILFSALFLVAVCFIANNAFGRIFRVETNIESLYITAIILSLIISPPKGLYDWDFLILAATAGVLAMASKYLLAIGKKHLFNPAAIAVVLTAFTIHQGASWWIGTPIMAAFVLAGGLLIVRKLKRSDLIISFFIVAIIGILTFNPETLLQTLWSLLIYSPLLFFGFVMLTEPLTTPPTRNLRIIYGALTGLLFSPAIHIGSLYFTPELALVAGNIFSYAVSPKEKLILKLKSKVKVAKDTYDFVFQPHKRMRFDPGQYLEWTLGHGKPDSRGNRRYFTIASAPTEEDLMMGVKFYPEPSTFKNKLLSMKEGEIISAGGRAGDFTLPDDPTEKLVFIAGGIGITPYRSMIKYLLDRNEKRPITLIYSNRTDEDIAYKDLFDEAENRLGLKTVYTITDQPIPANWQGSTGFIDEEMIRREVPDYKERIFYLSGPPSLVNTFDRILRKMRVSRTRIKKDFFPGYA